MINNYLFTDEFSARAIIKRIYLNKEDISADKLMLLVELLNQQQLVSKNPVSSLAGGRIRYEGYNFASGYLLKATLSQSQANGLLYILKNPYKSALKIFDNVFKNPFECDEKSLALAKDNVKEYQQNLFKDTYSFSLSELEVSYSRPIVNLNLISSMTIDDLKKSFDDIKKSKVGEYIYIGRKEKDSILETLIPFEKDFEGLPFSFTINNKDLYGQTFINDVYSQIFEFSKIKTLKDYELTKCVLNAFGRYFTKRIDEEYHVNISVKFDFISNIRAIMSIVIPIGKWSMIKPLFSDILTPHWLAKISEYYSYSLSQLEIENIQLSGNFVQSIHRKELLDDFHLQEDKLFNSSSEFSQDEFDSKAKEFKSVNVFKCIHDKGELVHD